jgi:predicted RNase H-related nuclease YkuK (DUF458 family)
LVSRTGFSIFEAMLEAGEIDWDQITFRTLQGGEVDNIISFVKNWLNEHPKGEIYVGTDSKARGSRVKYSTVICLWDVGYGVWEAYANFKLPRPKDRFTRLWHEVAFSVKVAAKLKDLGNIHVHMDYNSDPKFPSYQLYDAGIGLVQAMGFQGAGKPNAWAATSGANRHCQ